MGGRVNAWGIGRHATGITDETGNAISTRSFDDSVAYNDGKLEFATFPTILHVVLSKSRRIAQAEGPFEFNFTDEMQANTYINIDGEFYQVMKIDKITLEKHEMKSLLKMLRNDRTEIFNKP